MTPDRTTLVTSTHRVYCHDGEDRARRRARRARRRSSRLRGGREAPHRLRHGGRRRAHRQRDQRRHVRSARPLRGAALRPRGLRGDDRARRRRRRAEPAGLRAPASRASLCRHGQTPPALGSSRPRGRRPDLVAQAGDLACRPSRNGQRFATGRRASCSTIRISTTPALYLDRLEPIAALEAAPATARIGSSPRPRAISRSAWPTRTRSASPS